MNYMLSSPHFKFILNLSSLSLFFYFFHFDKCVRNTSAEKFRTLRLFGWRHLIKLISTNLQVLSGPCTLCCVSKVWPQRIFLFVSFFFSDLTTCLGIFIFWPMMYFFNSMSGHLHINIGTVSSFEIIA